MQQACLACKYENYTDVWDRFATRITTQLSGAWRAVHLLPDNAANFTHATPDRLQVAMIEPNDIDAFLRAWHPELKFEKVNEELLNRCYFRMSKEYLQQLAPAAEWYRRFVAGMAAEAERRRMRS